MTQPTSTTSRPISRVPLNMSFLVAMALFVLPFVNIRCMYSQQRVTGVQLVTGFENSNDFMGIGNRSLERNQPNVGKRTQPNVFAILALVAGIVGFGVSFSSSRKAGQWCFAAALSGVTAMIILFIDIKSSVKKIDLGDLGKSSEMNLQLTAEFTEWYYLCVIAFAVSAYFARKYMLAVNKVLLLGELDLPSPSSPSSASGTDGTAGASGNTVTSATAQDDQTA